MSNKFWIGLRNGLLISLFLWALIFESVTYGDDLDNFKKEQIQLQERLVSYQQIIQNLQVRIIELRALIQYIEKKEAEKVKME